MPPGKRQTALRIDKAPPLTVGSASADTAEDTAPPANPSIEAPDNLVLTTVIGYSSAAPSATISATWSQPIGTEPQRYVIQASTSDTFPAGTTRTETAPKERPNIAIDGLLPGVTYYVRVAAQYGGEQGAWSSMSPLVEFENYITSATDTTPAAQPTGLVGTWVGTGDLLLTWTNPTSANFKHVQIKIYASNGGTLLRTIDSAAGRFLYTAAMNLQDTSQAGDPSLYVEARSRTFSDVLNNTSAPTLSTTKSAPSTPTVTHSWTSDTGTAGADLTFNLTAVTDAARYKIALNAGTAREIGTTYTYTLDANIAQNGSADPTIGYSVAAVDGLGQSSSAATGTATNAAPPVPAVTVFGSAIGTFAIAKVGGAQAADFAKYEYVWKRDGSTVTTRETPDSENVYEMSAAADTGPHDWTCVVRQKDAFGQYSSTTTSSAVAIDALPLSKLREDVIYRDSEGTDPATLKAALADGVTNAGGITYNP